MNGVNGKPKQSKVAWGISGTLLVTLLGGGGYISNAMIVNEGRISTVEANVQHIKEDIEEVNAAQKELKQDFKDFSNEMRVAQMTILERLPPR